MISSSLSSSSLSSPLSFDLATESDQGENQLCSQCEQSNARETAIREVQKTDRKERRKPKIQEVEQQDAGRRSPSLPRGNTSQDPFFGLSLKYNFAQGDDPPSLPTTDELSFKSFVEALSEEQFVEQTPQTGRSGIDRYLATPRNGDAVRYFRPKSS